MIFRRSEKQIGDKKVKPYSDPKIAVRL